MGVGVGVEVGVGVGVGVAVGIGEGAVFETVMSTFAVPTYPWLSVALAAMVCEPFSNVLVFSSKVQLAVPLPGCGAFPSMLISTSATPSRSAAVPATDKVPDIVEPGAGVSIATLGAFARPGLIASAIGEKIINPHKRTNAMANVAASWLRIQRSIESPFSRGSAARAGADK